MKLFVITLGVTLFAGALSGCIEDAPAADGSFRPRPLDPLSEAEKELAVRVALADPGVEKLLDGRFRVIGAAVRVEKSRILAGDDVRLADIHVYHYGRNEVVWPIVDLTAEFVVDVTSSKFQPRLTAEELVDARAIAVVDERVREAFGDVEDLHVTGTVITGPTSPVPCDVHRCVEISLLRDGEHTHDILTVVDLSDRVVVTVTRLSNDSKPVEVSP